jgi:hypothetical protein
MNEITHIQPITDEQARELVSDDAMAELAELITSMPAEKHGSYYRPVRARGARRGMRARRWHAVVALAAIAVAAVLGVMSFGHAGSTVGPVQLGPDSALALSFNREGGYLVVIVRNPYADPARYRAEFAAHNLNVKLQMLPVSPSMVGSVIAFGGTNLAELKPITAKGQCTDSSGADCQVGIKVPINYTGAADIQFGRAAKPGEQYASAGSATAPGEAMHGLSYTGRTVATVLAMLKARGVTVPQYRYNEPNRNYTEALHPDQVPGDWVVIGASPWAPHQVMLFVQQKP